MLRGLDCTQQGTIQDGAGVEGVSEVIAGGGGVDVSMLRSPQIEEFNDC